MSTPLEIRNATKRYSSTYALHQYSASFAAGELVAILGLNGAGKSTLLRALTGGIGLNEGGVYINGKCFDGENLEMRRSFVYIPDTPPLLADETVFRNISIFLTQYLKTEEEHIGERVIELLEEFEVIQKANTKIEKLSRGEAYKVGLVILAAINPQLWILDEPFASGMDANGIRLFRKLSRQAVKEGKSVIYTTQLVDLAEKFSDKIYIINRGINYLETTAERLRDHVDEDMLLQKLAGSGEE